MPFEKEYFPVLKLKQGEITAWKHITHPLKVTVSPIFDAWVIDMSGKRAAAVGYCASLAARVHQLLPNKTMGTLFIDPSMAIDGATAEPPSDVCDALFHTPHKKKGVTRMPAPVYRLDIPSSAFASMDKAAIREGRALFRARIADTTDPNFLATVSGFIGRLAGHCKVGLVIDAERRVNNPVLAYATTYQSAYSAVIGAHNWNQIVVLSGSMPMNYPQLSKPGGDYVRHDFRFYEEMANLLQSPICMGDYGTVSPEFEDLAFSNPSIAAKIKYLVDKDKWFIAREGVTNRLGGSLAEYVKCASTIVGKSFFAGPAYSWAEERLDEAVTTGAAGQHVTWVSVAWVRHITRTADDISSLP